MRGSNDHSRDERERGAVIWGLVRRQHGAIARRQLLEAGLGPRQIERRIASGRLHPVWRGVYAVGRPLLDRHGRWMAAVLASGPDAVLSHASAAALWGFGYARGGVIEVSLPAARRSQRRGIRTHRRSDALLRDVATHEGIPLTSPVRTLIDQATHLRPLQLERAVNEADKLDRVRADVLAATLEHYRGQPGVAPLRKLLDPLTFRLSDSELEQLMRPLARSAGLPVPETKAWVNGHEVDFFWASLGIVVEADGLKYHRTASQQKRGLERDQAHLAAGMWPLRFSHWQVKYDPRHVRRILRSAVARAQAAAHGPAEPFAPGSGGKVTTRASDQKTGDSV
jgi:very-short-patch-repair endonuclease